MEEIIEPKEFPLNYASDVVSVIKAMSFQGKAKIVGSMSLKSQQYAGDYDMIEEVKAPYASASAAANAYAARLQQIVSNLITLPTVYIGDIKAGIVPEWLIVPDDVGIYDNKLVGYTPELYRQRLHSLHSSKVLSDSELDEALALVKDKPTVEEFMVMKKELRFHIVRWTPTEIKRGSKTLRGRTFTLQDAIQSPAIVKLDVVAFVQNNRFTDFSIIYLFYYTKGGKTLALNKLPTMDEKWLIQQDILYYMSVGNYFKVSKRLFSLAKQFKDTKTLTKLNSLLNSDLGRLYLFISDIGTLLFLLENESELPVEKIRYEIDQFRARLGTIYTVKDDHILHRILQAEQLPFTASGRTRLHTILSSISDALEHILSKESLAWMRYNKLLPLPARYAP